MITLKQEIIRYLGYGRSMPDGIILREIDWALEEFKSAIKPKSTYKILPLEIQGEFIRFATVSAQSKNLSRNLKGCKSVVVFGATLGVQADSIIARYSKINMAKAVIMQAVAAAVIEEYCDACQIDIGKSLEEKGLYLRPRFSPGYGDFDIKHQWDFINILESPKKIGLSLTESLLLVPTKSVTAVMGITEKTEDCGKYGLKGCEECEKTDCEYRR